MLITTNQDKGHSVFFFIASKKVAIVLLLLIILFSLVGVVVPQKSTSSLQQSFYWQIENPFFAKISVALGLESIFTSFAFISVATLLCFSVLACTYNRIEYFIRHKKNNVGKWGSVVFHIGVLVIFIGAILSVWTRFECLFLLTEGQMLQDFATEIKKVNEKAVWGFTPPNFSIKLKQFLPSSGDDQIAARDELVIIEKGNPSISAQVRPYHAYTHKGFTIYQKQHGYSPRFVLQTLDGKNLFDAFVALKTQDTFGGKRLFEDEFSIQGTAIHIKAKLFPQGRQALAQLNKNVLNIEVTMQDEIIYAGNLETGSTVRFGMYRLIFSDLRYWSSFKVVKDMGAPVIFAGFFLGILGLFFRLFPATKFSNMNKKVNTWRILT